jgi:hypothetical protein
MPKPSQPKDFCLPWAHPDHVQLGATLREPGGCRRQLTECRCVEERDALEVNSHSSLVSASIEQRCPQWLYSDQVEFAPQNYDEFVTRTAE